MSEDTYPPDFFTDAMIRDVYLNAERSGEPINERHLASIRKHRAIELLLQEEEGGAYSYPEIAA